MKPLSNKSRVFLVIVLFILFLMIGPVILIYSFGYRLDDALSIVKTGGIYIHSDQTNTRVFVNGEFYKNGGVFLRNVLIQDLRPNKIYELLVQKDGYHDWRKKIDVFPSLVSEVRILMLPNEIEKREIYKYLDDKGNATSTRPKIVAPVVTNSYLNGEYEDVALLFKTATSTKDTDSEGVTDKKDIPEYFEKLGIVDPEKLKNLIVYNDEVSWIENGNVLINWIGDENSLPFYYCIDHENCREKIVLDWANQIVKFEYMPDRSDVLLVLVRDGLYAVEVDDRSERNIQPVYLEKDIDFRTDRDRLFIKDGESYFELYL